MKYSALIIFTLLCHTSWSQNASKGIEEQETLYDIEKKTYDLLYKQSWFEKDSIVEYSINLPKHEIIRYSDEEIIAMMEKMQTSFPVNFNNIVKQYIEQYAENRRLLMSQSLGLGQLYFPLFEEALDKHDVPLILKYLPIIESNINPFAKSSSGARGLWQFMLRTGQSFGLEVNDYIDQRCDAKLSTNAAAKYLHELYHSYHDWLLVLAAYNAGPGNVNKAIGLAGGKKNYWEIRPYLPKETRDYIPKFIACAFVMEYHENYKLLAKQPSDHFFLTDTILIKEKVSIKYIAELIGVDSAYLQFINPSLKSGIVPKSENGISINIPYDYLGQVAYMKTFFDQDPYLAEVKAEVIEVEVPVYTVYKVKSGDTLSAIGSKYGVGVSQIKKWNSLKSDSLKIGQKLILYV